MANALLTPTAVTREALRILHEKLNFVGSIDRQYDDRFARNGAKIGDTLTIRLPNQYTVRTGKTIDVQDTNEQSTVLTVATQNGVDMSFSSAELTMEMQDFSRRVIEPAMAVLASHIESVTLQGVTQDVYNLVGTPGTTPNDTLFFGQARAKLNQYLAPKDNNRCVILDSLAMGTMVDHLQGLFHDSTQVSEQYREGMMGRHAGFDWLENERIYVHTNGDDVAGAVDEPSGTNLVEGTTTLHMDALGTSVTEGSVFTIAGVLAVHPETKVSYAHEQQFVVVGTPTIASNEGDVTFAPAIYTSASGGLQNVDHMPSDNDVVTFVGSASTAYEQHLAFHKEVATFATADLVLPDGVDFAAREVYDGISMRIARAWDINNDNFPCRVDVLWGYKTIRPQLGCRITG